MSISVLYCRQLFTTCYMSTVNSSGETQERARRLAEQIGSNHISINIDEAVSANVAIFAQVSEDVHNRERFYCTLVYWIASFIIHVHVNSYT